MFSSPMIPSGKTTFSLEEAEEWKKSDEYGRKDYVICDMPEENNG